MQFLVDVSSRSGGHLAELVVDLVGAVARANVRSYCPPLYTSEVAYGYEPPGTELVLDWAACTRKGTGDCASLSAWRLANLWQNGDTKARAAVEVRPVSGELHVIVRHGNGTLEDPSFILGMKKG